MAYDRYQHFILEKKLADKLRKGTLEDRRVLYRKVYNDLFTTYPEISHHWDTSTSDRIGWQLKFLHPLFDKNKTLLEIGAGDCVLSKELTKHFNNVVAYEVADSIPFVEGKPNNFELKIFNGFDMSEQAATYDIIYSNQVFEHLHPDDTTPLLEAYHSFLKSDGKLVMVTPHKMTGPHDISKYFSDTAEGFHLKEYTYKDIRALLKASGYRKIKGYIGHRKLGYIGLNISFLVFIENVYSRFPRFMKKSLRHGSLLHSLFGLKVIAKKSPMHRKYSE